MGARRERVKVLVVDDRPENLLVMENILKPLDVEVLTAGSGPDALSLLVDHDVALVILDVQMPGMDGFEVAEVMRKNPLTAHVPIIFVTAISKEEQYVFRGYEVGAVDYLAKPIDTHVLLSKVRVFIQLYEQKRELKEKTEELERKISELEETKRKLEELNRKLEDLSSLDGLTGIPNRRRFDELLEMEWKRSARNGTWISLCMLDIDHFKSFNDNYGHLEGDECLKKVAAVLKRGIWRPADVVARFGGEEFAVILPETDLEGASVVGRRLREDVEREKIPHRYSSVSDVVTVSVGVAGCIPPPGSLPSRLIEEADRMLYEAKKSGRNRVVASPSPLRLG
ncbi:MAG: diguanylate cyclase [Deltaproteobacteria bacterium]|nr:MAG: diguanylate cyclase [Deltaproteobacteria bacterium]